MDIEHFVMVSTAFATGKKGAAKIDCEDILIIICNLITAYFVFDCFLDSAIIILTMVLIFLFVYIILIL